MPETAKRLGNLSSRRRGEAHPDACFIDDFRKVLESIDDVSLSRAEEEFSAAGETTGSDKAKGGDGVDDHSSVDNFDTPAGPQLGSSHQQAGGQAVVPKTPPARSHSRNGPARLGGQAQPETPLGQGPKKAFSDKGLEKELVDEREGRPAVPHP